MTRFVFVAAALFAFGGCATEKTYDVKVEERVGEVEKTVAKISVDGMMCEIACGGKIRKELSELPGVASASIEYNEGDESDYALVEFNPELVSEDQLASTINTISDGRLYSVSEVIVTHYAPAGSESRTSSTDGVNMEMPQVVIPGVTDLVWNLIGGFRR